MSSVSSSIMHSAGDKNFAAESVRWQSWPLVEYRRWSWAVVVAILAIGGGVEYLSGSWMGGFVAVGALAAALWQFFLPVTYEVYALGFRRRVLGRARLVPWHAVRAYRPLSTGIVLYQCIDPTAVDALRSMFLPYPADEDEMLCAVREYLAHAAELP